jgi:hypothetical protein
VSTLSDADVPLVHTSYTCTEKTAAELAKEGIWRAWRTPRLWAVVIVASVIETFLFSPLWETSEDLWVIFSIALVSLVALLGLLFWWSYNLRKRALTAICKPGAILRAEFGPESFTTRFPRRIAHIRYDELKPMFVGARAVVYTLKHQPLHPRTAPRELFPAQALELIGQQVRIYKRGAGRDPVAPRDQPRRQITNTPEDADVPLVRTS